MKAKKRGIARLLADAHRGFEIVLGVVLGVASIVPAGLAVGAIVTLPMGGTDVPAWALAVGGVTMSLFTWFCVTTTWRLITGRERRGGGLLHPWFLYAAAFVQTCVGAGRGITYGPQSALQYHSAAAELIATARARQGSGTKNGNRKRAVRKLERPSQ
jgi:hypothetical protein